MYSKGDFGGMLFAEFQDQYQQDLAVTSLKTAGIQYAGRPVWAAPDCNPVERASHNFCFGLKRVCQVDWKIPYTVHVNDQVPNTDTVGGELALTAHVSAREVVHKWHGEWATWDELHNGKELKDLLRKSNELIAKASQGLKGVSKGERACWHEFSFTRGRTCCFRRCNFGRW